MIFSIVISLGPYGNANYKYDNNWYIDREPVVQHQDHWYWARTGSQISSFHEAGLNTAMVRQQHQQQTLAHNQQRLDTWKNMKFFKDLFNIRIPHSYTFSEYLGDSQSIYHTVSTESGNWFLDNRHIVKEDRLWYYRDTGHKTGFSHQIERAISQIKKNIQEEQEAQERLERWNSHQKN